MAQLMPLPLTVSCFSKSQIGFTLLVPAHPGSPGQRAVKRVCVCFKVTVWTQAGGQIHKTALADLGFFYRGGGDFGNPSEQSDRTLRGSVGLWENEI